MSKRTGALRVVDRARRCHPRGRAAEFAVAWSKRGPAGATGTDGKDGKDGTDGTSPFLATAGSDARFSCSSSPGGWCRIADQPGATVLSLQSPPSDVAGSNEWTSTGPLVLTRDALVFISASLEYTSPNGGSTKDANCRISDNAGASVGHQTAYIRTSSDTSTTLSFTEVANLPAGSHDLQLFCYSYGTPSQAAESAGLTAVAVAPPGT